MFHDFDGRIIMTQAISTGVFAIHEEARFRAGLLVWNQDGSLFLAHVSTCFSYATACPPWVVWRGCVALCKLGATRSFLGISTAFNVSLKNAQLNR